MNIFDRVKRLPKVSLVPVFFIFMGHLMFPSSALWAQEEAQRDEQQPRGLEPIFAVLQGELIFDRSMASASGQILANQILCVRLKDLDVYQGL